MARNQQDGRQGSRMGQFFGRPKRNKPAEKPPETNAPTAAPQPEPSTIPDPAPTLSEQDLAALSAALSGGSSGGSPQPEPQPEAKPKSEPEPEPQPEGIIPYPRGFDASLVPEEERQQMERVMRREITLASARFEGIPYRATLYAIIHKKDEDDRYFPLDDYVERLLKRPDDAPPVMDTIKDLQKEGTLEIRWCFSNRNWSPVVVELPEDISKDLIKVQKAEDDRIRKELAERFAAEDKELEAEEAAKAGQEAGKSVPESSEPAPQMVKLDAKTLRTMLDLFTPEERETYINDFVQANAGALRDSDNIKKIINELSLDQRKLFASALARASQITS